MYPPPKAWRLCWIAILMLVSLHSAATDRYWVGLVSTDWNVPGNWSSASGGAGGAGVPGSADLAIFDNAFNGDCIIDAAVNVLGIRIDGFSGTITQNGFAIVAGASGYTQYSGSFLGGAADITVAGTGLFVLSGGDFTSSSGRLIITGYRNTDQTLLTISGGDFNANNGTVVINPSHNCATRVYTLDVLPTTLFYDMEINGLYNCVSSIIATADGDTVHIANDLVHSDGVLNGQFSVKGNLIINAAADGGTGTVVLDGTGNQTYTAAAGGPRTCQLVVDKPSGTLSPAAGTTELYVQGFTLLAGVFTAPSGVMNIGGRWDTNVTLFQHTGGAFDANNGTVVINPSHNCATRVYTLDVLPTTLFYDMEINGLYNCVSSIIATADGDTVHIGNDLIHSDGVLNGQFSVKGNLIINAAADGGTGTVVLNGEAGDQTYAVAGGTPRTCQLVVDKPSGAVKPAEGTSDFYIQGLNILAGGFTAPSGVMNIGGEWNTNATLFQHTGGDFDANGGTVEINPSHNCATRVYTLDVLPTTLFYNLEIKGLYNCVNSVIATGAGDTVQVTNDLIHSDGILNGQFSVKGDLIINAAADGGTGTIVLNGEAGDQTYTVAAGTPRTCQIVVDKPSGAVKPAAGTTDFYIQGLRILAGGFTAPSGVMNIGGEWNTNATLFQHTGGAFDANGGTVEINPSHNCATRVYTLDVLPATLFYNVKINGLYNCVNSVITTASGDTVQVTNDLIHSDGIINGQFAVKGDLIVDAGADGGTGTILLNGSADQTYAVAAGTPRTCQIVVDKPSGGVMPASGTTDFYIQGLRLLSGGFTAPPGNMNIGGEWNTNLTLFMHAGGDFDANAGTVEINPSHGCATRVYTIDVIPGTVFYNFVINGLYNCSNSTIASAAGDTLQVMNNLRYQDGISTARIAVAGNVTVLPSFNGGNGQLIFKGESDQDFDLSGADGLFDGPILIKKPSGSVNLLSACLLDAAGQTITFQKGKLVSSAANLLTIGDNVAVLASGDSSFVDGPVAKTGNDAFVFPVGKNNAYAPIGISAPGNTTDRFLAEYFPADPDPLYDKTAKAITLDLISSCEYWSLDRSAGLSDVSVILSWDTSRSCDVVDTAYIVVARWDGAQWQDEGVGGTTGTRAKGTIISGGAVGGYGPFTLSSPALLIVLPEGALNLTGRREGRKNTLVWNPVPDEGSTGFIVERSRDGLDWVAIARVDGKANRSGSGGYSYVDVDPYEEISYYRLQQVGLSGKPRYSPAITIKYRGEDQPGLVIYPNPSKGVFNFLYGNGEEKIHSIEIYNALGRKVYGTDKFLRTIDLSGLSPGVYTAGVGVANGVIMKRIVIKR